METEKVYICEECCAVFARKWNHYETICPVCKNENEYDEPYALIKEFV